MRVAFHVLDVFTDRRFGGNPLAVIPDASGIPEKLLQPIAREFNLSETVFVTPPTDGRATKRARIFTPAKELPFAGHPTVGTGFLLADLGLVKTSGDEATIVLEEGVGLVPVRVRSKDGRPVFAELSAAKLPEKGTAPASDAIAAAISLAPGDLLATGGDRPEAWSCGLPFLFVPVLDRAALARARVDPARFESALRGSWATAIQVFTRDAETTGASIRARTFVPDLGVPEDPATGSAAAAFAGYAAARDRSGAPTIRYVVEQGFEMGRPSLLHVEIDRDGGGGVTAVRVGGACVRVSDGELSLD